MYLVSAKLATCSTDRVGLSLACSAAASVYMAKTPAADMLHRRHVLYISHIDVVGTAHAPAQPVSSLDKCVRSAAQRLTLRHASAANDLVCPGCVTAG